MKNDNFTLLPALSGGPETQLAYMVSKNSPLFLEYLNYFLQYQENQTHPINGQE